MAGNRENSAVLTGGLVSLSVHVLIGSAVLVLPAPRMIAGAGVGDAGAPLLLYDPSKLPPPEELAAPPITPPDTAVKPIEPPPLVAAPPPIPPAEPLEPPKPKQVAIGVENGTPKSPAWIKSVADGEHSAMQSVVEQPALSQTGGAAGPAGVPTPAAPAATPDQPPPQAPSALPAPVAQDQSIDPSKGPTPPKPNASDKPNESTAPGDESHTSPRPPIDLPISDKERDGPKPFELDISKLALSERPDGPERDRQPGQLNVPVSPLLDGPRKEAPKPDQGDASQTSPSLTIGSTPNAVPITPSPAQAPSPATAPKPEIEATRPKAGSTTAEPAAAPAAPADTTSPGAAKVVDRSQDASTSPDANAQPNRTARPPVDGLPGAGGRGDNRGDKADRDSDAATLKRSAKYFRSGRVDAGEGLEIRTVRPNYTLFAQTFTNPRNPVVEMHFARDGTVRFVKIVRSSGYQGEVDEPIIASCYNWQASGRALRELPDRPDAAVVLTIHFLLQ